MNKQILITSVLLSLTFAINGQDWWGNGKKIKGNGNVVTLERTTSDYEAIKVGGSFEVLLISGKEGNISIKGEENILPYIVTEVSGNTLTIKYKRNTNIKTTKKLSVTVPFSEIKSVALGGSGSISSKSTIKGANLKVSLGGSGDIVLKINSDILQASLGGSGNINLEGITQELNVSIAGSGSIGAYALKTDELNATIAGSGSIKTSVHNTIKAKLVGSGNIFYKGDPKRIDRKSIGSGKVVATN